MGGRLNQQDAQHLVAWNVGRQRLGASRREEDEVRLVVTGRRQALLAVVAVESIPLAVVIFVGRKQRVLTGTLGIRSGTVLPAAAVSSEGALALASEVIVAVRAVEGASRTAHSEEEQARENDVHQRFGNCLHGQTTELPGIGGVDSNLAGGCQALILPQAGSASIASCVSIVRLRFPLSSITARNGSSTGNGLHFRQDD